MKIRAKVLAVVVGGLASTSAMASTVDFGFTRVEPHNSAQNPASQLRMSVSDVSGHPDQVTFKFTNNVGIVSSISEIYYDDRNPFQLLTLSSLTQVGCSFTGGGANPGNLPGGQNLTPAFQAVSSFSADAVGNPSVGIDTSADYLVMKFDLQPGATFSTVLDALAGGTLRVGLHVRAIGTQGGSDAFVNGGADVVPVPAAAWAGGAMLLGVAARRRFRAR